MPPRWKALLPALGLICSSSLFAQDLSAIYKNFQKPPADARVMMRWWWFGPTVTKPELEREMRAMRAGGFGGFEIQPVYPMTLEDPAKGIRTLPFLSDEFIDVLRFAGEKGHELGLRVDLTLGSGWPYGGPNIPITQAAGRLRCDRVPVTPGNPMIPLPKISEGERYLAAFLARGTKDRFAGGSLKRLPAPQGGQVALPAGLQGDHVVLFFISSRTRMMVKRPSVGAEGYVLDHYDRSALDNHLKTVGDRLMQAFASRKPYAIFCDSLEVFGSDWTSDFLEEFRKRRGYDLEPLMPALAGDIGEKTGAVRNDWAQTLTDLAEERFLKPLREWAQKNGTRLRCQTYGVPPVTLSSARLVDLPEGEGSHWNAFTSSRWASSSSHMLGVPVTSSETWTWLHSPAFRATPLDMKAEADRHFLQGINQLIGHGWPYSPPWAGKPGWAFYAAAVFNDSNPWWVVMPDVALYLQRVSYLMRVGKPANDVALYTPVADIRAQFTLGRVSVDRGMPGTPAARLIPKLLAAGYNFDLFDDGLVDAASRYRVIVLPGVERIPLATYRALEQYARKGGILVATERAPSMSPGMRNAEADSREIRAISARLFEGPKAPGQLIPDTAALREKLNSLLTPDMALDPALPEVGFIRRDAGAVQIYFIANTGNRPVSARARFRVSGMKGEWWDPMTGGAKAAGEGPEYPISLQPFESRVLVFAKSVSSSPWKPPAGVKPVSIDLSAGWKVTFDDLKKTVTMDKLRSWTEDEATKFYSGTATYEKTFQLGADVLKSGGRLFLHFGDGAPLPEKEHKQPGMSAPFEPPVGEAAVVYVNGKRAGSVWTPPFEVEATNLLQPGANTLKVVVANTAINQLAGRPRADYTELNRRYGVRFVPQDTENIQPVRSGLLGGVRLYAKNAGQ